jgi:cytochrome c-type biogenesis protein CcmH
MAAPDTRLRRPSLATLLLIAAALAAGGSVGYSVLRGGGGARAADPLAKDWRTVGWAYADKGDGAASAAAYRKAADIEPDNAENWSSLGEALQAGSKSVVPEAAAALRKALSLDASDPRARYFLAVQKDLSGDHKGAVHDWLALLGDSPADAPWTADLRRNIEETSKRYKITTKWVVSPLTDVPPPTTAIPGPTQEQLAAASSIPPGEQDKMVNDMVERLTKRLETNPRDADGWIRLMRSRKVLGDAPGAAKALQSGLTAFRDDPATQARLRSAAAQVGVGGG